MDMKILSPFFLLVLLSGVFSCSGGSRPQIVKHEKKKSHILIKTDKVEADKMLSAKIEGMMCEKGCGSSIRKELMNTNAVQSCEFDFESDRKENRVSIAFDQDKISVDRLISILNKINDKQFRVTKSSTSDIQPGKPTDDSKEESYIQEESTDVHLQKDEAHIVSADSTFETPNLLQIFSRIITG